MTSKEYLSQEEIDALLKKSGETESAAQAPAPSIDQYLTPMEVDALGEIGNITFGSAATALSTLLGRKVDITTPVIRVLHKDGLEEEFLRPHVAVHVHYVDGFEGVNSLVIKTRDAQVIADLMLGGDGMNISGDELNEIHISAVQEAMNQMMGSSATSMSTIFNQLVNISPPGIGILDMENGEGNEMLPEDNVLIKISFRLMIGDLIDSTIMQLLNVPFAKDMVHRLMGGALEGQDEAVLAETPVMESPVAAAAAVEAPPAPVTSPPVANPEPAARQEAPQAYAMGQPGAPVPQEHGYAAEPMYAQPQAQPRDYGHVQAAPARPVNVQPVQFADLHQASSAPVDSNLNLLMDIPLRVTVELGRTHKQIKDILELSQGSIIELDKLAGEPVDILVNNKLIAKGEVVVIDENFGVRVTDILNQWDRIQKLQ
ncbi:flagellar motor switch phosphatase FliY [Paenibacillus aquistagni]|uniref:flagellar motor switch phosphatase FliY n=1 Tax=Paenibacillus aquistagni TaxID=1852522 RepID=UPI00145A5FA6|nr:flagellar motor switch phosphatase FliY [Paenibacillus aquistagni]NMM51235.1 flagellar motor switch phosphatase FliY [Paenibacillus aquistagni]